MVNSMGGALGMGAAGSAPGTQGPPPVPGALAFHIAVNGQQTGPFEINALQGQVASGQLKRDSLVWKVGMAQWSKAGEVAELAELFANLPPPLPPSA